MKNTNQEKIETIWELIRDFSPSHPDYGIVVTFLAKFAEILKKEGDN